MNKRIAGFTLIALMVVIFIISMLAVWLLPNVLGAQETANKLGDERNLGWHYQNMQMYKTRYKGRMPRYGGHKFVFDPWCRGVVSHTDQNRDRFFSPQVLATGDWRYDELLEMDVKEIWSDIDEISSADTNYAGRAREHKRTMLSGDQIIMATDNEEGNIYKDGTVIVLFGDGVTRQLNRDPDLAKHGYSQDIDDEDEHIEVGPESLHPGLKLLEK